MHNGTRLHSFSNKQPLETLFMFILIILVPSIFFFFFACIFIIIDNKTPRESSKELHKERKAFQCTEIGAIHQKLWVLQIDLPVNGGIPFVINVHLMQIEHSRGNRLPWQSSGICLLILCLCFLSFLSLLGKSAYKLSISKNQSQVQCTNLQVLEFLYFCFYFSKYIK